MTDYYQKYMKYKNKYLSLKQIGGKDNHFDVKIECIYVKSAVGKSTEEQESCVMPSTKLKFVDQDISWVDIIDKINDAKVLKNKIDARQVRKITARTQEDDKMRIDDVNETVLLANNNSFKKLQIFLNPVDDISKEFFELDDDRDDIEERDEMSY